MEQQYPYSILFVCLGNICRSPLAEVIFKDLVKKSGLEENFYIESCGTGGWHVGAPAHSGSKEVASRYGLSLESHQAQQLHSADFERFDLLVAMDRDNKRDIRKKRGNEKVEVICLREFDSEADSLDVPDPYYLPRDSFGTVYQIINRSCENLLAQLRVDLEL